MVETIVLIGSHQELARKYEKVKDLVIAKMDGEMNEAAAGFVVSSYPLIYWSPRGSQVSPIKYQGDLSLQTLVNFLEDSSSVLRSYREKDEL